MTRTRQAIVCAGLVGVLLGPYLRRAEAGGGSIVGWGSQVVGVDLSGGFVAVAGGGVHSLGLKGVGIESVASMADHGAAGEIGLNVNLTASMLPADGALVTTESREAGITKLVIDCDGDVTLPSPPEDAVQSIVGVNNGDVTGNVLSVTALADVITIHLTALPDQDTYTVTLAAEAIAGDNDFMIRALQGEVNNAKYDIVSDGAINPLDMSRCRSCFAHTAP